MSQRNSESTTAARFRLLVVDDQGPVGEIISRIARQGGWESIHTVTSQRVEEIIKAESIDVLLIDYAIDGNPRSARNGLSIVEEIRAAGLKIPVIVFSGWTDLIDKRRARELGVQRILEKPLSIQDLRDALAEAKMAILTRRAA